MIQHRDQGKLDVSFLGLKARGLAFKAGFLAIGEARIASPIELASPGEDVALALLVEPSCMEVLWL